MNFLREPKYPLCADCPARFSIEWGVLIEQALLLFMIALFWGIIFFLWMQEAAR